MHTFALQVGPKQLRVATRTLPQCLTGLRARVCARVCVQGILRQSKLRSISKSDAEMNKLNCNGKSESVHLGVPNRTTTVLLVLPV